MNSKTTALTIIALAAMMVCIAAPVSADNVMVTSKVSPFMSFALNGTDINFPLTIVGQNDITSPNLVTVSTNTAYKLEFRDFYTTPPTGAPAGSTGHMISGDGSHWTGKMLTNPIQVGINSDPYVAMTGTNQIMHQNLTSGETFSAPLKFRQVTTYADPVLPAGPLNLYGATVTITCTAL